MYFWKIEPLKEEFRKGNFKDKDVISYIVIYVALYAVGMELMGYFPDEGINFWTYVLSIMNVFVPIGGIIYAYKLNGGPNGKDFALKYFGIGFVVLIRFIIYLIPVLVIMMVYWWFVFGDQKEYPTTFIEAAVFTTWHVLFYLRMAKHIRDTTMA